MSTSGSSASPGELERGRIGAGCEVDRAGRRAGLTARVSGRAAATLASWGPRVALSVLDQGLFSGANFLLNVLLARWLPLAEYGAFSVAFTLFLFLSGFHNALLLEPMAALGVRYRGESLPGYLRSLLRIHAALTAALSALVMFGALAAPDGRIRSALLGLALTLPLLLLFWLARRACYLETRPGAAALGSVVYVLILLAVAAWLGIDHLLTPLTAFLVLGAASLASSTVAAVRLGVVTPRRSGGDPRLRVRAVAAEHWDYSRWVVASTIASLLTTQVQTYTAAALLGVEGAGILRALSNFMLPMAQTATAIGTLGLPVLAADFQEGRHAEMAGKANRISFGLAVAAVVYELGLLAFGGPLEHLMYGGRFAGQVWLAPLAGLVPVFVAISTGFSVELRAAQRPDRTFLATALAIPAALVSSVALTALHGVAGAIESLALTYAVTAALICWFSRSSRMSLARRSARPAVVRGPAIEGHR